ncbi:Oxygen regulatory protein NreC [Rubripirellula reticaptiva]|uniref:Oxygen regulatory protein NreC n=2 Tax=Rubripirellula reticaptiva TaxID=2528013 RepID=A0A5C6F787_9BACT|nr:Oxygen regulatory protein NreC [Rubripirellula reticaptiva]
MSHQRNSFHRDTQYIGMGQDVDYESIHPFFGDLLDLHRQDSIFIPSHRITMSSESPQDNSTSARSDIRIDPPAYDPTSIWAALSCTPGIGVSITDVEGRLIFVNDTSMVLFSQATKLDYLGKRISDYHSSEFVGERLAMIRRVVDENRPLSIHHIYHGQRIESTVWPIRDKRPPYDRVIVISHSQVISTNSVQTGAVEVVSSQFINLGELDILSNREFEVLVLLGHGMSVPSIAKALHRSPKTVERHKSSISQKLNVSGQAEIVSIVTSIGLKIEDVRLKRLPS